MKKVKVFVLVLLGLVALMAIMSAIGMGIGYIVHKTGISWQIMPFIGFLMLAMMITSEITSDER